MIGYHADVQTARLGEVMGQYLVENGRLVNNETTIDEQWLFGVGAFTTAKFVDGEFLYWEDHLSRLKKSAKYLWSCSDEFEKKLEELPYIVNKWVATESEKTWGIRINLTTGPDQEIRIHVLPRHFSSETKVLKVMTSELEKPNSPFPSFLKRPDYLLAKKGMEEAQQANCDEVIFLNEHREVTEAAFSNVFLISKDTIYTPPVGPCVLDGITRKIVISLAGKLGIKVLERTLRRSQLSHMDAAFLTNSLSGISPISKWDNIELDAEHSIVMKLMKGMK